jgi:Secretion system C-terminal sorting domain
MNKFTALFIILVTTFLIANSKIMQAQIIRTASGTIIEPSAGYINEIINGDTTSSGVRNDSTYIFRRGATYFLNSAIDNVGYTLTLKAQDSSGAKPIFANWPNTSGTLDREVNVEYNCYIKSIFLDGMGPNTTTGQPDPAYAMNGQLVRAGAPGHYFIADSCILTNCEQVIIRSNSGASKVEFTNSIIANSGQLSVDNIGNGRVIDLRNGATDTVIFKNCTMINFYDRIFRHFNSTTNSTTDYIKDVILDHNTIINNGGAFGFLMLGDISDHAQITNNLFYNPMALGEDTTDHSRQAEVAYFGEKYPNGDYILPLIMDEPNSNISPTYTITNNVVSYDTSLLNYFTQNNIFPAPPLTKRLADTLGAQEPVTANVTLKNVPKLFMNILEWYRVVGYAGSTSDSLDMDRHTRQYWLDSLDCSYTTSNSAFVGSDGLPVGATTWNSMITAIKDKSPQVVKSFSLSQNYPNPFNPSTIIDYSIGKSQLVTLNVYNVLGQEVASLVNKQQNAGDYQISFNASNLASGVYFYKLVTGNFVQIKKMMLLK